MRPANGLDPAGIVGMRDTLRALAASGKTVFVSSHIPVRVQQMADVVGIIGQGRLIREGTVESLLREGSIRIRVAREVATAAGVLTSAVGQSRCRRRWSRPAGDGAGRSLEVVGLGRALAGAGVYASRIEGAANLEACSSSSRGRRQTSAADPEGRPAARSGRGGELGQPGRRIRHDRAAVMRLTREPAQARPPAATGHVHPAARLLGLIYLALIASTQRTQDPATALAARAVVTFRAPTRGPCR
jgi:hypothetical protein